MTRHILSKLVFGVWALGTLSCSEGLIRNPNIERWCGDTPCDWQVEGEVERVGTWHPNDYAVSLESDDAALIQENAKVDYRDTDCFEFEMVAKIDRGVKVFLELDFLADGSVEFSQRLPESKWQRRSFRVTAPDWYKKVRFIIRKEGPGQALLAEITARTADHQCTAPPIELAERPEGALCADSDQCAAALACISGRCGACGDDRSCADNEVCGLKDVGDERYHVCIERASTPFGAACDVDAQCATGACNSGACSECKSDTECEEGRACRPAGDWASTSRFWPRVCGGGQRSRETGESCLGDVDCRSGECQDEEVTCDLSLRCQPGAAVSCLSCAPEIQLGTCR